MFTVLTWAGLEEIKLLQRRGGNYKIIIIFARSHRENGLALTSAALGWNAKPEMWSQAKRSLCPCELPKV